MPEPDNVTTRALPGTSRYPVPSGTSRHDLHPPEYETFPPKKEQHVNRITGNVHLKFDKNATMKATAIRDREIQQGATDDEAQIGNLNRREGRR